MMPKGIHLIFRALCLKGIMQLSASARAMLLLSFMMILIAVVATTVLLIDLRKGELADAKRDIASLNRVLAEQSTRTFEGVALMMQGARERLSDDMGRRLELASFPVHILLRARASGLPQVKSLFVVDQDGFGVNSSRPDFIPRLDMTHRSFFSHFASGNRDELFVSLPEKARVDGQWTFYVSARLLDPAGQFRGVLVAAISIDYFESLYESIGSDFVSQIMLLDKHGLLLAGSPHDEANYGKAGVSAAAMAEIGNSDNNLVFTEPASDGRRFVALRKVAQFPLTISAAVKEEEALLPWRRVVLPITAAVTMAVIFVLVITFFLLRSLLRREALESDLKDSDEKLRHMVQSARDAIVTVNAEQRVVLFNAAAARLFGIHAEAVIGRNLDEWQRLAKYPPCGSVLQHFFEEGVKSPPGLAILGIVEVGDGEKNIPVELSLSSTMVHDQILVTAVFRDLTERRRAEAELLKTNRQLQELSTALQNVREQERAYISRELHDELGQLMTGIRMEVSWLGSRLAAEQPQLLDKVGAIKGLIDQTIVSVRRISSELRPLVLDDLGFSAAASWYVDQFSARTGLEVILQLPEGDAQQNDAVATALFRVLQESLTNVARYAQATRVEIQLDFRAGKWILSVKDDGVGFTQDASPSGGIGLIGMRERVHSLGGSFAVLSPLGAGTVIQVSIPAEVSNESRDGKI